jgi:hypothetical protein
MLMMKQNESQAHTGGHMPTLESLAKKLAEVDEKLADAEGRLPAHSVRPGQMAALFQLEEERETLVARIDALRKSQVH